jgi:hypothetical protein
VPRELALGPRVDPRAFPFVHVAGIEVGDRIARVEELEEVPFGVGERRGRLRHRHAGRPHQYAAETYRSHAAQYAKSIKGDSHL